MPVSSTTGDLRVFTGADGWLHMLAAEKANPSTGVRRLLYRRYDPNTELWSVFKPIAAPVSYAGSGVALAGGLLYVFYHAPGLTTLCRVSSIFRLLFRSLESPEALAACDASA